MRQVGLAMVAMSALCAFAAAASASAATQHWAGTSNPPLTASQSFSGKNSGNFLLRWEPWGSVQVLVECSSMTTSGSVENPTGGSAGELHPVDFTLGSCITNAPGCVLKEESIAFELTTGETLIAAGKHIIKYSGKYGGLGRFVLQGDSCYFAGNYPIDGEIEAEGYPGSPFPDVPGEYDIEGVDGEIEIGGSTATVEGSYFLHTSSEVPLVIASEGWGEPQWYAGSPEWTKFAEGVQTSFSTVQDVKPFEIETEAFSAPIEVSCTESELTGSVVNPVGGNTGRLTGSVELDGCSTDLTDCTVEPIQSTQLEGRAREEAGAAPKVELSPVEGNVISKVTFSGPNCILPGTTFLEGDLLVTAERGGHFGLSGRMRHLFFWGEEAYARGGLTLATSDGRTLGFQS